MFSNSEYSKYEACFIYERKNISKPNQIFRKYFQDTIKTKQMSRQDDCTRNVSKGMISLMKLLDSYDNCIDVSDHEIPENLTLSLNADVKHSRRYIWDEECHQEDAPKIGVAGVKEKMKVLQDEIKKKTVQVTELKTVMARKRLAKERNVKKLREDGEKRMEFLKQEYDKVSVCPLFVD